ncbi:myosin heavy chain, clone 203 isoform X1 [Drosophila takahashii]|uniref:myosin heavy chain, clone 203 isoform X1 n=1 Tax=Drosophila takahashii TaxID=29030 RepID=UPI001CF8F20B|nr:myosin-2 heavy chain, non muscle [Drosophila takahashii]
MLRPSKGSLATRQRTLGFRPQNRERIPSTSMGLDFVLDEKREDMPDEKSSYVSLSRQNSNIQDSMSASSLGFRDHSSSGVRPKNSKEIKEVDLIMSDGEPEPEDYRENGDSERRLPNSEAIGSKLKEELCKYKQELKEYNETTKDLEEKYMKINYELSEMQQKHHDFVSSRRQTSEMNMGSEADPHSFYSSASSVASQMTIRRKSPQILRSNTSFMTVLSAQSSCDQIGRKKYSSERSDHRPKHRGNKGSLSSQVDSVFNSRIVETLANRHVKRRKSSLEQEDREREPASFKDVYHVLKDVINTSQDHKYKHERDRDRDRDSGDLSQLLTTIKSLKSEQLQFQTLIRQQQERIADYHTRCLKAHDIMSTQKHEIEKLHVNNKQLESSIYHDIDSLRSKIDTKLKSVSHLPKMMRDEHTKYEKVMRENCLLADKLHALQQEAMKLKVKIDDLGRRKLVTINRLKAAERDLKIFKNYNSALKTEKRKLTQELSTMKDQLEQLQASSKRQLSRHREQSEKQRRDLQKKIYDLELKLSRSQNSTSSLIQERDSLIAELQTQLHTLVHNFEVSQKHIRVLRRHIYSMTNPGGAGIGCGGGGSAGIAHLPGGGSHRPSLIRINQQASSTGRLGSPRTLKAKI